MRIRLDEMAGMWKILVAPLVLTLAGIMALVTVILPLIYSVGDKVAQTKVAKQKQEVLLGKKSYLVAFDEEELKNNIDLLSSALLRESNAYYLVGIIRSIAEKHDYSIQNFSVSLGSLSQDKTKSAKSGFTGVPVELSLFGPKNRYLELLKALENSLPLLALTKFEQKNSASNETTELVLAISAFYFSEGSDLDIDKLTTVDLALKKEETDVIGRLSEFEVVSTTDGLIGNEATKSFTRFERGNPFSF